MNQNKIDQWPKKARDIKSKLDDAGTLLAEIEGMLNENPMWREGKEAIQKITEEIETIKNEICIPTDCTGD